MSGSGVKSDVLLLTLTMLAVFNLENFKGGHFHSISDENIKNCPIFPHSHDNVKDGPL